MDMGPVFYFLGFLVAMVTGECLETCGNTKLPYPFFVNSGLAAPCNDTKRHGFGLFCDKNKTLELELDAVKYRVLNFSHVNTIIIDPSSRIEPMKDDLTTCKSSSIFNLSSSRNFALSFDNFLALYGCNNTNSTCPSNCNNSRIIQRINSSDSGSGVLKCPGRELSCCYDMQFASTQMLREFDWRALGCSGFSSWIITFKEKDSQVDWDPSYGLGLEWSLDGTCSSGFSSSSRKKMGHCATNAHCHNATLQGHICVCDDNYEGEPYKAGCNKRVGEALRLRQKSVKSPIMFAGIVAGATVLAGILIAVALVKRRRQQLRFSGGGSTTRTYRDAKQLSKLLSRCGSCNAAKLFTYKELERATKGFSPSQMLGHGGHGTVYAGKLLDGREVAVKRINHVSLRGIEQVMNEVKVLLTVNHPNLVQLLGCCLEVYDPLLVYEYVPNGTLAEHLQRKRGEGLDWYTRIGIAFEAAQALSYLHNVVKVYHRDVKSTNILVDFEYNTKVGDFGLSKLILTEDSHISTAPQGTPGYLDPEYHQNFQLSDKSDVYSFGVVLVEILTAMKVVDFTRDKREVNLAALAVGKIATDSLEDILDPILQANKNPLVRCMVQRVGELAFRCLAYEKDARPPMIEVLEELEGIKNACMSPEANSPIRDMKLDETVLMPR